MITRHYCSVELDYEHVYIVGLDTEVKSVKIDYALVFTFKTFGLHSIDVEIVKAIATVLDGSEVDITVFELENEIEREGSGFYIFACDIDFESKNLTIY